MPVCQKRVKSGVSTVEGHEGDVHWEYQPTWCGEMGRVATCVQERHDVGARGQESKKVDLLGKLACRIRGPTVERQSLYRNFLARPLSLRLKDTGEAAYPDEGLDQVVVALPRKGFPR